MEVMLVKEVVQILPVSEVTCRSNCSLHPFPVTPIPDVRQEDRYIFDGETYFSLSNTENELTPALKISSTLQVSISSVCSDRSELTEEFAKRLESMLRNKNESWEWNQIHCDIFISSRSFQQDSYFEVSSFSILATTDVFEQLKDEFGAKFNVEISLCHLPYQYAAVLPESFISLKGDFGRRIPVRSYPEIQLWLEGNTGFIYFKVSVQASLIKEAVNRVYRHMDTNESLLQDFDFTDLEIICKGGEVVPCHRAILARQSEVLRAKFVNLIKQEGQAGPWKMEMPANKESVDGFLEYIYYGGVAKGLANCSICLEMLTAAQQFEVLGLKKAMLEIIMAKGLYDFEYFTVEGALDLFLYAKSQVGLITLRDKAVRVLQNYLRIKSDKILESRRYQDLFENQPRLAMELSTLFIQLA